MHFLKMKLVLLCFIFTIVSAEGILSHTNIGKFLGNINLKLQENKLSVPANVTVDRDFLEEVFQGFRNVIDDPLTIKEQKFHYEMKDDDKLKEVLRLHGYVRHLQVKNLKNLTVDHIKISNDTLYSEFIVRVPVLEIAGQYNTSCYLKQYDFDMYGNGTFQWLIYDFQIRVNFTLKKMLSKYMQLEKIDWDQSIRNSKFEIKNLLNDEAVSSVVSEILSVVIPPMHDFFKPAINEFTSRLVVLCTEALFSNLKAKEEFIGLLYAFKEKAKSDNQL